MAGFRPPPVSFYYQPLTRAADGFIIRARDDISSGTTPTESDVSTAVLNSPTPSPPTCPTGSSLTALIHHNDQSEVLKRHIFGRQVVLTHRETWVLNIYDSANICPSRVPTSPGHDQNLLSYFVSATLFKASPCYMPFNTKSHDQPDPDSAIATTTFHSYGD
ncbi:hypothetical protein E4U19_000368 [Claviceps sp. Clav32 group G5]|nr:hypothetical protein E4U40_000873 [Claviceps sp. LM458 group G5]KAG6038492.1 hypothetical protein E4U19_000368 [Claviceps sp. Clav32 group G5]KAG6050738.1 hypothetical protein E4U39_003252 [Claviceps sp. Clav50 group G5]